MPISWVCGNPRMPRCQHVNTYPKSGGLASLLEQLTPMYQMAVSSRPGSEVVVVCEKCGWTQEIKVTQNAAP